MNTVEGMQNIFSIVPSHFIQMFAFIFTYSHISDFSFVPFERQSSAYNMSQYIRSLQAVFFFFFCFIFATNAMAVHRTFILQEDFIRKHLCSLMFDMKVISVKRIITDYIFVSFLLVTFLSMQTSFLRHLT